MVYASCKFDIDKNAGKITIKQWKSKVLIKTIMILEINVYNTMWQFSKMATIFIIKHCWYVLKLKSKYNIEKKWDETK